jgi:hypothetical protein
VGQGGRRRAPWACDTMYRQQCTAAPYPIFDYSMAVAP